MTRKMLMGMCIVFGTASNSALSADQFYIGGYIGSAASRLHASSDYAGASGYISPDSPTGKMGELGTKSSPTFGLSAGYTLSDHLSVEISYANLDYGSTRWGTDFDSYNGTYNATLAVPFVGRLHSRAYLVGLNYEGVLYGEWIWQAGAAIGLARNTFETASEGDYAMVFANTKTRFAYKFSAGLGYRLGERAAIMANVWLLDIGDFESAKSRNNLGIGAIEAISPYKFETKCQPMVSVGLRFNF
jgi:hypothetical protein